MSDSNEVLVALYDAVCRAEEEISELKAAFPEVLHADRNRVLASLSCCRVSLELRVKSPRRNKPDAPSTGVGLWANSLNLTRSD
jgi:hypothetical protein